MNLDEIRAELPVLERVAYLNTGTFGPLPRAAAAAVAARERQDLERGRSGPGVFDEARRLREEVRAGLAEALGASSDTIALTRSTSEACALVLAGLGLGSDDEIVTTDVEHFGLLGALGASSARVRIAAVLDRPASAAFESISAEVGSKTRLVALSHVAWSTGQILPIEEVAGLGVPVLVDGAQGAGAVPTDVHALRCDFYTVSGQKWLLGPDATGALYVRKDWHERLRVALPSYYSVVSHEPDGTFTPAAGAGRFDAGTIPYPSLAGLLASLRFAEALGPRRFTTARAGAERCLELLQERVEVVTEAGQATLVSFVPKGEPADTVARLGAAGVVVRDIPRLGWVRASIGFWTSDDDLERLVRGL